MARNKWLYSWIELWPRQARLYWISLVSTTLVSIILVSIILVSILVSIILVRTDVCLLACEATRACSASATQHAFLVINEVAVKVWELLQRPYLQAGFVREDLPFQS